MIDNKVIPTQQRTIIANNPPLGYAFNGWTGDTQFLADPNAMRTVVTMPDADVTVTSNYLLNAAAIIHFGYLYNLYSVIDTKKLNSSDIWRLPDLSEISALAIHIGGTGVLGSSDINYGRKLLSTNVNYCSPVGTDDYGLSLVSGGYRNKVAGAFGTILTSGQYWTSYNSWPNDYSAFAVISTNDYIQQPLRAGISDNLQVWGNSVRYVKTATGIQDGTETTYIGNDGKVYNCICVNQLYWLKSNLAETKFRDGSIIPFAGANTINYTNAEWIALTGSARCAYGNDDSKV